MDAPVCGGNHDVAPTHDTKPMGLMRVRRLNQNATDYEYQCSECGHRKVIRYYLKSGKRLYL